MQIKKQIQAYLQTKYELFGFFLLLLSLFGGIFFFGHLPWNYFVLGAELSSFLLLVYLMSGRKAWKKPWNGWKGRKRKKNAGG